MNNAQTHLKMGYVWTICLVAACGGLLFGYDWVVIGGAKPFYEAWFSITDPAQSGWAMSSALVGCVFGALISGWCADKLGRKLPLILSAVLFSASAWGTAVASSFDMFVVYRIVGGVGIGLASALSPLYIAEVSPAEKRGRFVAVNQLTIVIGVLAAQLINLMIAEPVETGATQQMIVETWNGQMGWRWMFITIGVLGIFVAIGWYMLYRNREDIPLTADEQAYLNAGSVNVRRDPLSFAEWRSLFKNKTMWGMMLGFSGINYTAWLYLAWLPGYLQTAYNLDLKSTGFMAAIPFLFGAAGMLINGYVTDWLVKGGMAPIKSRKICIIAGMFCSAAFTLIVPHATTSIAAVLLIGMALFCIHFAGTSCWGLIHVAVASRMTASVGSIQNFASFICASFAPVVTGFIVDTTHSFQLALVICGCVTALGALAYIFLVRQPISDPRNG